MPIQYSDRGESGHCDRSCPVGLTRLMCLLLILCFAGCKLQCVCKLHTTQSENAYSVVKMLYIGLQSIVLCSVASSNQPAKQNTPIERYLYGVVPPAQVPVNSSMSDSS